VQANDVRKRIPVTSAEIRALAFSANGDWLAWGARDKTAKISDASTGKVLATLTGHDGSVYGLAVSPDGQTLATGSSDKTARLWDWQGKQNARSC
jgi:WD40 repeat protein